MSRTSLLEFVKRKIADGEWEEVTKIVGSRRLKAYRRVKK